MTPSSPSCSAASRKTPSSRKWAGGLGGSWTAVRGTGGYIKGTNGESPGRHPLPQAPQRPARRRQPGRQAPRLRLRLSRNLAQRHRGLPRAAQEHRRRAPPHARHEHRELDSRPVHEAHGGPRALDPLPRQRSARSPRPLRQRLREALLRIRSAGRAKARSGRARSPAIELWKNDAQDALRDRPPLDHLQGPLQRPLPAGPRAASSTQSTSAPRSRSTPPPTKPPSATSAPSSSTPTSRRDGALDHDDAARDHPIAVRALDNVIDINFYPTEAAKTANTRHRPIGLGVMGLQNALYKRGLAFASRGRRRVQRRVHGSHRLLRLRSLQRPRRRSAAPTPATKAPNGTAASSRRTPSTSSKHERGRKIDVPRGGKMDWSAVREKIAKHGMRNSNVLAIAPTATISNIMGTTPCIEPNYKNLYVKSNLCGEFIVLNSVPREGPEEARPLEPGNARPAQVLRRRARSTSTRSPTTSSASTRPSSASTTNTSSTPPPAARSGSTRASRVNLFLADPGHEDPLPHVPPRLATRASRPPTTSAPSAPPTSRRPPST